MMFIDSTEEHPSRASPAIGLEARQPPRRGPGRAGYLGVGAATIDFPSKRSA